MTISAVGLLLIGYNNTRDWIYTLLSLKCIYLVSTRHFAFFC